MIIGTIKLKKVKNPLENDGTLKESMEEGLEKHPVDRSKLDSETQKLIEQYSNDK